MPFIPAPQVVEVELRYDFVDQQCENTLYFKHDTLFTADQMRVLATAMETWWESSLSGYMHTAVALNSIKVSSLSSADAEAVIVTPTASIHGGDSAEALPFNASWAVKFTTDHRGRSARGRNYMVGLTRGSRETSNVVTTGYANGVVTSYTALLAGGETLPEGWTWVVLSRFAGNAPRTAGVTYPITGVGYTDRIIDSQRRRLPGRGV